MKTKPIRRPAAVKFYWFQGASVRELYDRLSAAGPDAARFEVHISAGKATLEVVPEGETAKVRPNPPINDSHACPPTCP